MVIEMLEHMEVPENSHIAIRVSFLGKMKGFIAHLKCIYTNASSMGNKQKELKAIVQLENCDIVAIMETWWDNLHNWSAAVDGHKLARRDRQGKEVVG